MKKIINLLTLFFLVAQSNVILIDAMGSERQLDSIEIRGPMVVENNTEVKYEFVAYYNDGSWDFITPDNWDLFCKEGVIWTLDCPVVDFFDDGYLIAYDVTEEKKVCLKIRYGEGLIDLHAKKFVTIKDSTYVASTNGRGEYLLAEESSDESNTEDEANTSEGESGESSNEDFDLLNLPENVKETMLTTEELQRGRAIRPLANIKYGAHERNVMDFWKAKSDKPTPVLVNFHGGGFVQGDKKLSKLQKKCLKNGISAVSANYRFVKSEDVTIREVMHDGARVIQFIRSKAKEWNIDPTRIALSGGSAGGNMSLWLALHDDLADPTSKDPLSRFSTRVTCVVAIDAQTSNDVNFIRKNIGGKSSIHRAVTLMYSVDTIEELEEPENLKMMEEFSAINHTTKDDPPIYLSYTRAPGEGLLSEKTPTFISAHSATFGLLLKEELVPLGIECHVGYPRNRLKESELECLLRHFRI